MITLKRFRQLKHGDIIIWGRRTQRTVIVGPVDFVLRNPNPKKERSNDHIVFAIRHRSWTGRGTTSYGFNDVRWIIRATNRSRRTIVSREEIFQLRKNRFDPRAVFERQVNDELSCAERMRRPTFKCLTSARIRSAKRTVA